MMAVGDRLVEALVLALREHAVAEQRDERGREDSGDDWDGEARHSGSPGYCADVRLPCADRRKFLVRRTLDRATRRSQPTEVPLSTPPPLLPAGRDPAPTPRERLRRAHDDLHPGSTWRGAVLTALQAVDDPSPVRIRALFWLHDALTMLLPIEPGADSLEERVLRRASAAIEDEIVADHVSSLRIA
jgi:hypothetical protein